MRSRPFPLRASPFRKSLAAASPAWLACLLLASCIGGTGTDTENGIAGLEGFRYGTAARVLDGEGRPLAGVEVLLHRPGFRPDSGAPEALVADAGRPLVSNAEGYVTFHLLEPGKYVVEARRDGVPLLFDTLPVSDTHAPSIFAYRARAASPVQGRVRLGSGLKVDSGSVFVRGTSRSAVLGPDGAYDLGPLPGDVGRMAIGVVYRASLREARIAEQRPPDRSVDTASIGPGLLDTSKPVFTCREATADSAARFTRDRTPTAVSGPANAAADTFALDTARLSAVGRSCDSLPGGTLVAIRAVRSGDTMTAGVKAMDSVAVNYLAVEGEGSTVLVPLNGCVAAPGTEVTTFALSLRSAVRGSDLHVRDVDARCLR